LGGGGKGGSKRNVLLYKELIKEYFSSVQRRNISKTAGVVNDSQTNEKEGKGEIHPKKNKKKKKGKERGGSKVA